MLNYFYLSAGLSALSKLSAVPFSSEHPVSVMVMSSIKAAKYRENLYMAGLLETNFKAECFSGP